MQFTDDEPLQPREEEALDEQLAEMIDALPSLQGLPAMLAWLNRVPWFSALGRGRDSDVSAAAIAYGEALGFPETEAAFLEDLDDALDAALSLDLNGAGWEAEEQARAVLTADLTDLLGDDILHMVMLHVMQEVGQTLEQAAVDASVRLGIQDDDFLRAAVGSGVQAAHNAVLVGLMGETDHPFARKLEIYNAGRWPLNLVGNSLLIF